MPTIFHRYNELLKRHPFKTNMVSTGLFFGFGDAIAQSCFPHKFTKEEKDEKTGFTKQVEVVADYSIDRTLRALVYGSFFFAPLSVIWHGKTLPKIKNPFINFNRRNQMRNDPLQYPRLHLYDTLFRLSIDQLFIPGLIWIPLYNTVMVILAQHHDPFTVIKNKLETNWWTVLKASWTVWVPFQLLNLYFVPVYLRIVCSNIYAVGWNSFLSFIHNTKGHGKGSGKKIEELVDIEDDSNLTTMVYD
ncbi:unnamed protein product [Candida verbasci]|uniref:Protein SYM1 n=1 Tax=Candida verbasci TaxID=1227364 RepID=A0A9W4XL24_9ASCO|nr:unnamed protein product [Candida verbasci]